MSWQSDIVTAIKADSPVAALIGTQVFADIAPGNATAPFIVFQSISDGSQTTFDGVRDPASHAQSVLASLPAGALAFAAHVRHTDCAGALLNVPSAHASHVTANAVKLSKPFACSASETSVRRSASTLSYV